MKALMVGIALMIIGNGYLERSVKHTVVEAPVTHTELYEFQVGCWHDGMHYPVYYTAPKPESYEVEQQMCAFPSINGKFKE